MYVLVVLLAAIMFWILGVWKRFLTKQFVMTDVFVGIPCIFIVCFLLVPPDLSLI